MKYIYGTSQMSKLSLTLCTFSIAGSVAGLFLTKETFELIVMFFGLTNSPATFQVMIDNLLRDIIKVGDIVAFINNVIVGTETEEGYDVEVLRRMVENDLFVKPEKCIFKK